MNSRPAPCLTSCLVLNSKQYLNSSGYTPECREHLAVIACIFKYLTYTSVWSAKPALILDKKFLKKGSQKLVIPNNSRAKIYKKIYLHNQVLKTYQEMLK